MASTLLKTAAAPNGKLRTQSVGCWVWAGACSQLEQDRHGGDVSISGGDNLSRCPFIILLVCSCSSYFVQSPGAEASLGCCGMHDGHLHHSLPMVAKSLDEKNMF